MRCTRQPGGISPRAHRPCCRWQLRAELGPRIAAERQQRRQEALLHREREAEERRQAAERATPEYQAKAQAQREKVSQMLDELRVQLRTGKQP